MAQAKEAASVSFYFTPTSSSWLNQVERWFGIITDRMIWRGTFCSVQELKRTTYQVACHLEQPAKAIYLESHRRRYPRQGPPLPPKLLQNLRWDRRTGAAACPR